MIVARSRTEPVPAGGDRHRKVNDDFALLLLWLTVEYPGPLHDPPLTGTPRRLREDSKHAKRTRSVLHSLSLVPLGNGEMNVPVCVDPANEPTISPRNVDDVRRTRTS